MTDIIESVRARHRPSPTAPDFCIFCDDDKWPCDPLLLCDALDEARAEIARQIALADNAVLARVEALCADMESRRSFADGLIHAEQLRAVLSDDADCSHLGETSTRPTSLPGGHRP